MDKKERVKILNRALKIAENINESTGKTYKQCILEGIERACNEFEVSVDIFASNFK